MKITHEDDHQFKKLLIVNQILFVTEIRNVKRTVWRIWMLVLGCKGLKRLLPYGNGEVNSAINNHI